MDRTIRCKERILSVALRYFCEKEVEMQGKIHKALTKFGLRKSDHLEVASFARDAGISHPTAKKISMPLFNPNWPFYYSVPIRSCEKILKASKTNFSDTGILYSLLRRKNLGD